MSADAAVHDALHAGRALVKVISPTDAGATGSHQAGLYLPRRAWPLFTRTAPEKGTNHRDDVRILWPDGRTTASAITWYGEGTRSEFRLTRFGRDFPWLEPENVGALLVLVPFGQGAFHAHVLTHDEDEDTLEAALSLDWQDGWGLYDRSAAAVDPESCHAEFVRKSIAALDDFPDGRTMAALAHAAVEECRPDLLTKSADLRLLAWMDAEYALYRALERKVSLPEITRGFDSVDGFLAVAATLMNRRKSRAGHSLEHHVARLLTDAGIAFEAQAVIDGTVRPDLLLPGKSAYEDPAWPVENLVVAGIKTSCRDRWRQVLNEGRRVPAKHLLTLQPAMSAGQLSEMAAARLTLVVPAPHHKDYATVPGMTVLTYEAFLTEMRSRFPRP